MTVYDNQLVLCRFSSLFRASLSRQGFQELGFFERHFKQIYDYSIKYLFRQIIQVKHTEIPMCEGTCLIYCENKWGTQNYWPHECIGRTKCTCGISGAECD